VATQATLVSTVGKREARTEPLVDTRVTLETTVGKREEKTEP
jgi:hypothetical protein